MENPRIIYRNGDIKKSEDTRCVALVAAFRDGKLLLGRRWDNGKWTLPGGHLNEGEQPAKAAIRELYEEAGLKPKDMWKLEERQVGSTTIHTFKVELDAGEPTSENDPDDEVSDWVFVDVADGVPKDIADNAHGPKDVKDNVLLDIFGFKKSESTFLPDLNMVRLAKMQTPPTFPLLGLEDRRETPVISTPQQLKHKQRQAEWMLNRVGHPTPKFEAHQTMQSAAGAVFSPMQANVSFAKDPSLRDQPADEINRLVQENPKAGLATTQHENYHQIMRRIEGKYGIRARAYVSVNLMNSVPYEVLRFTRPFLDVRNAGMPMNHPYRAEEDIAAMHNYLNNPGEREAFHRHAGHNLVQRAVVESAIKAAFKHIHRTAQNVDSSWMLGPKNISTPTKWTPEGALAARFHPPTPAQRPTQPAPQPAVSSPSPKKPVAKKPRAKKPSGQLDLFKYEFDEELLEKMGPDDAITEQRVRVEAGRRAQQYKDSVARFKNLEVDDPQGPVPAPPEAEGTRFSHLEVDGAPKPAAPVELPKPKKPKLVNRPAMAAYPMFDYSHHLPDEHVKAGWALHGTVGASGNPYVMLYDPDGWMMAQKTAEPTESGKGGWNFRLRHVHNNMPEQLHDNLSQALSEHVDMHTSGELQRMAAEAPKVEEPEPEGPKRIHNRYADSKTTESSAKLFGSSRKMSERKAFDYSHRLSDQQRAAGYSLTVYHHPQTAGVPVIAELNHNGKRVGSRAWLGRAQPRGPHDRVEEGHGAAGHRMFDAIMENIQHRDRKVRSISGHGISEIPYLDTLELPNEGSRFQQLEVDKGRKKKAKPLPADTAPGRGAFLEVGDEVNTNPAKLVSASGGNEQWDYSHVLHPDEQEKGYRVSVYQSKDGDQRATLYRSKTGTTVAEMLWGGGYHGRPGWNAVLRQALTQHRTPKAPQNEPLPNIVSPEQFVEQDPNRLPLKEGESRTLSGDDIERSRRNQWLLSRNAWDYSHQLTPEQRADGWRLIMHHTPGNHDNFMGLHAYKNNVDEGSVWAYPHSAESEGGHWSNPYRPGLARSSGLEPQMKAAMRQHARLLRQRQLDHLMDNQVSRFSQLETDDPTPKPEPRQALNDPHTGEEMWDYSNHLPEDYRQRGWTAMVHYRPGYYDPEVHIRDGSGTLMLSGNNPVVAQAEQSILHQHASRTQKPQATRFDMLELSEKPMAKTEDDEIDRLLLHPNPAERRMALKLYSVKSKHLARAFEQDDPGLHRAALAHPALDRHALLHLMQLPNRSELQLKALHHPRIDHDHIEALYHTHRPLPFLQKRAVMDAISHHDKLPPHLIEQMISEGNGAAVVEHAHTPPHILAHLVEEHFKNPDDLAIRHMARRALRHPNIEPHVVMDAYKRGGKDIKLAIAGGPTMPEDLAYDTMAGGQLPTNDHEAFLRHTVVCNPKASQRHLETALKDRNFVVRHTAQQRLGGTSLSKFEDQRAAWLDAQLLKAIHPKNLQALSTSTQMSGGQALVDHSDEKNAHPPQHGALVQAYKQGILDHPEYLEPHKPEAMKQGVTPKAVFRLGHHHPTHAGHAFMLKPYHETPFARRFQPHCGWSEMTNQSLYHAGGIGDIHQAVHVAEHNMAHSTEPTPAIVVHMAPGMNTLGDEDFSARHVPDELREHGRKIAIMDFLGANNDRHDQNLLVGGMEPHPDDEYINRPTKLLAIDHGLAFNYGHTSRDEVTFGDYVDATNRLHGDLYSSKTDDWKDAFDWWAQHSMPIRQAFAKRVEKIKDERTQNYLKRNFMHRVQHLDALAQHGLDSFEQDKYNRWYDKLVPVAKLDEQQVGDEELDRDWKQFLKG